MENADQDVVLEPLPDFNEPSPPDPWKIHLAEQALINPYLEGCISIKDIYGWGENHYCQMHYGFFFKAEGGQVILLSEQPEQEVEIEGNQLTVDKVKEDVKNITLYSMDVESAIEFMPPLAITGLKGRFQLDAMRKIQNPEGTLKEVIYKQEV